MAKDRSVLVVGAGPTGLVIAGELARRRVHCRLIDIARAPTDLSKAIGIQARTLEVFQNMGLSEQFMAIGNKTHAASIYDGNMRIAHVSFDGLDSPFPYLLVLPQSETERILLRHLESLGISVERGVRLTAFTQDESEIHATLQHTDGTLETARTNMLIGCDGAHSTVRHGLDLAFSGEEYPEGFLLADVRIDWSLPDDEVYIFARDGWILGAFPFGNGRCRLVGSLPPEDAPVDQQPSLAECQALMDERSPVPAHLSDPHWTAHYRIHRRIVSRLREGRVFLVGDAAHIHSPAGAQGMNTGIQDAFNLAWKLALVIQGASSELLLDSYEAERLPVEQGVLQATELLLKGVSMRQPVARAVRDLLAPRLTQLPAIQGAIRDRISEVAVSYPHSPIVAEAGHPITFHNGPAPGERAPDACVTVLPTAAQSTLYDLLRDGSHTLLLFSGPAPSSNIYKELEALADQVTQQYGLHITTRLVLGGSAVPTTRPLAKLSSDAAILDSDQTLHRRYQADAPYMYLIRPDGYVGFRSLSVEYEPLRHYLRDIFSD